MRSFKLISAFLFFGVVTSTATGCTPMNDEPVTSTSSEEPQNTTSDEEKYTIIWKNYDGTILETDSNVSAGTVPYYNGSTPVKPATDQYSYTFVDWSPRVTAVTGDAVYTAVFENILNKYTVTWVNYDGSVLDSENVNFGTVPTFKGSTPSKPSTDDYRYSFSGWSPEISEVIEDVTYTAQFLEEDNVYNLSFVFGNGDPAYTATVKYGDPIEAPENPSKYGYTFCGWDYAVPETMPDEDMTFTAVYMPTLYGFSYNYNLPGGVTNEGNPTSYTIESETLKLVAPVCEGYTFCGWYSDSKLTNQVTEIPSGSTGRVELYAKWKPKTYRVTWKNYDDTVLGIFDYEYGTTPTFDGTPTKPSTLEKSYVFNGWEPEVKSITEDAIYTATFTEETAKYHISFCDHHLNTTTILDEQTLEYGDTPVFSKETPTREPDEEYVYVFNGWSPEISEVKHDQTYFAKWMCYTNSYDINFYNYDGTLLEHQNLQYGDVPEYHGETPTKPSDSKYNYHFIGWSQEITSVSEDTKYYAVYGPDPVEYTLTFVLENGEENIQQKVRYGQSITAPEDPTRAGHTFAGWDKDIPETMPDSDLTITARWTMDVCTVTWKNYDDTVLEVDEEVQCGSTPHYDGEVPTRPTDAQYTYTFAGWSPVVGNVEADTVYRAVYNCVTNCYTVIWVNYDNSTLEQDYNVPYGQTPSYNGSTPTKPDDGTYEYTFSGWDPIVTDVVGNAQYTAQFQQQLIVYSVTFDMNGGTSPSYVESIEFNSFSPSDLFYDCEKENYNFRGWEYNGERIVDENGILLKNPQLVKNMTFRAIFSQTAKLTIVVNDGFGVAVESISDNEEYAFNTDVDIFAHPKQGYRFIGWYYNNLLISSDEEYKYKMWSEDIVLEARFSFDSFTTSIMTYQENLGKVMIVDNNDPSKEYLEYDEKEFLYLSEITVAAYSLTTTRFLGWFDVNNNLVSSQPVYTFAAPNQDYILIAKWDCFIVTYSLNDGDNNVNNVDSYSADEVVILYAASKDGYQFDGWMLGDQFVSEIPGEMRSHVSLTAVFSPITYSIYYNLSGGTNNPNNPSSFTIESETIVLHDPTRNGYYFIGWSFYGTQITEIPNGSYGNLYLDANWQLITYEMSIYTDAKGFENAVTFDSQGGSSVSTQYVSYSKGVKYPAIPTKSGYVFGGWYADSECTVLYDFTEEIKEDITLYAKWVSHSGVDVINVNTSKSITAYSYNATKRYYAFIPLVSGTYTFYSTGSLNTIGYLYNSSKTLLTSSASGGNGSNYQFTYNCVARELYYISPCYNTSSSSYTGTTTAGISGPMPSDGGIGVFAAFYTIESETIELTAVEKDYYSFVGWYTDSAFENEITEIPSGSTGDIVLYTKWTPINYAISYELNGGVNDEFNTSSYNIESETVVFQNPTRIGYQFAGWYSEAEFEHQVTSIPSGSHGDIVLFAKWTPAAYNISYELNGGTNNPGNPTGFNIESATIDFVNPTKVGYDFSGWYTESTFENQITQIPNGSHGDVSVFAKWTPTTYSIVYNLNGGTNNPSNPSTLNIESEAIELVNPNRVGYDFIGWYTESTFINKITSIPSGSHDIVYLYAKWTPTIYHITYNPSFSFVVSFNSQGGSSVSSQTITDYNSLAYPTAPTKSGYVFAGWYTESSCTHSYNFTSPISSDVTLYAKWVSHSGSNVLNINVGKWITAYSYNNTGNRYIAFMPLVSGTYSFVSSGASGTYGVRCYLYNSSKTQMTSSNTGSAQGNFSFTYNLSAGLLYYIRPCYNYSSSSSSTTINVTITGPMPSDGGVKDYYSTYTIETGAFALPNRERDYYSFDGWYTEQTFENQITNIPAGSHGDLTLYAKYTPISYNISYELYGGTNDEGNPSSYNVTSSKINLKTPSKTNYSFDGWYTEPTFENQITNIPAGSHGDLELYAKWIDYAVNLTCDSITCISEHASLVASDFNATAIDTDGNPQDIKVELLSGTLSAGSTITVRLTSYGLFYRYATKLISNIKVYGDPTITYDTEKDYINLSDVLNASLFAASATNTYGNPVDTSLYIKEGQRNPGDYVTIVLSATDIAGNTTVIEIPNVKVFGGAVFSRDENKTTIREIDTISNELFSVSATDHFGEELEATTYILSGSQVGGNTITVKSEATDSKGNTSYITYSIKVYSTPVITSPTVTNFKVTDEITVSALGITARDSFNKVITSDVILDLISGEKESGSVQTYRATISDHLGNTNYIEFDVRLFGQIDIVYTPITSMNYNQTISASTFVASATDAFDNTLSVTVTLEEGVVTGGTYVKYRLSATDQVGNTHYVITDAIKVYSPEDITITYDSSINSIKYSSHGEEFGVVATNSFGDELEVHLEAASGYTIAKGNTINLYLVATDICGNVKKSALIVDVKVYGMPSLNYLRDYLYIQNGDSPYALISVIDSFGQELLFTVNTVSGSLDVNETITYRITATDIVGHAFSEDLTLVVLDANESILDLYYNNEKIGSQRVYKGSNFALPTYPGYLTTWRYNNQDITNNASESLSPWNKDSNGYRVDLTKSAISYHIYANKNGGQWTAQIPSQFTVESDTIVFPTLTRTHYTFEGLYTEPTFENLVTEIPTGTIGDVTVYAKWTPVQYTITYNLNGGTNSQNNPSEYNVETETFILSSPTREAYNFVGWYLDSTFNNSINTIVQGSYGDYVLYAKWVPVQYIISYQLNGGNIQEEYPEYYNIESNTIVLAVPTFPGFAFVGWYTESTFENEITQITHGSIGNVVIYAKWTPVQYTITYNLNGGTNSQNNPSSYTIESDSIDLSDPTRTGYTFVGWYTEETFDNVISEIDNCSICDYVLYAKWTPTIYSINYTLNGGDYVENPTSYNIESDTIVFNEPSKDYYTFVGWYTESTFEHKITQIENGSIGNVILFAKWTPITYTISYELNGGVAEKVYTTEYTYESDAISLGNPTRDYYTFAGWYTDSSLISKITSVPAHSHYNYTLYAAWDVITYSINYHLPAGATSSNPNTYHVASSTINLTDASRNGYIFEGWYSESEFENQVTSIPSGSHGDIDLYPKWSLVNYAISYILIVNEYPIIGEYANNPDNPASYDIETIVVLGDPTRDYFVFAGWFTDNSFAENTRITQIPIGSTGNVCVYAKWTPIDYSITYHLNGGTNNPDNPSTYNVRTYVGFLSPTRDYYTFSGWYLSPSFVSADYTTGFHEGTLHEDIELYAKWTPANYSISYNYFDGQNSLSNPSTYNIESSTISLAAPTRYGYEFVGWYTNPSYDESTKITEIVSGSHGNLILYAKFIPAFTYTVSNNEATITGYVGNSDTVLIPSTLIDGTAIVAIAGNAFANNTNIQTVSIANTVTSIGAEAFSGCSSLRFIIIPESVSFIGTNAFASCSNNLVINLMFSSVESLMNLDGKQSLKVAKEVRTFNASNISEEVNVFTVPSTVKAIPNYAFCGLNKATSITLPSSVTSIGTEAFANCSSITTISISNVTSIGEGAFMNCSSLATITLNKKLKAIAANTFRNTGISTITIPETVTSIGEYAFAYCDSLTNILIFMNVQTMGAHVFGCCSNQDLTIKCEASSKPDGWSSSWNSSDCNVLWGQLDNPDCLFISGTTVTGVNTSAYSGGRIVIPNGITKIGKNAFSGNGVFNTLTSIYIPNTVTYIDSYAFNGCEYITTLIIPNSVETINNDAFYGLQRITSVEIPDSVVTLGSQAFRLCTRLKSVTIPGSITTINTATFYGCDVLEEVIIGNGVETIGQDAFYDCYKLKTIVLPNTVTSIGDRSFGGCSKLESVTLSTGLSTITANAFYGCTSLVSIDIPGNITSIGDSAFYGCTSLKEVTLHEGLLSVGQNAFYNTAIRLIVIPDSVTTIGQRAFAIGEYSTVIYNGASSKPSGWNTSWNGSYSSEKPKVIFNTSDKYIVLVVDNLGKYDNNSYKTSVTSQILNGTGFTWYLDPEFNAPVTFTSGRFYAPDGVHITYIYGRQ